MALGIGFTALWTQKADAREFMRNEIQRSGRADKIPPERMEAALDTQSRLFKPISWASAVVGPPIIAVVVAGLYLFVFRFFYAGEVSFAQSLSVVAWSFFAVA